MDADIVQVALAHRYLYYVLMSPVLSDQEYDRIEEAAVEIAPDDSPIHDPGSDLDESYSQEVKQLAYRLLNNKGE